MRLASISTATFLACVLPCIAEELPKGFETVGKYTLSVDGAALELRSVSNRTIEYSDLYYQGELDSKTYTFKAAGGIRGDTESIPPILLVDITPDASRDEYTIRSIIFVDIGWEAPLVANPDQKLGSIAYRDLSFDKNGDVHFDFDATMIRLDWQSYSALADASTVQIHGQFSGKMPSFARRYPYNPGDY